MIWAHITQSFRESFHTRASEWALATMLFLWAVMLVVNPDLFAAGQSYAKLADLMSQETWALLCFIAGGGRLLMLAVNGAWRRSPHLRAVGAFVSCFFWLQISIGMLQSGTFATGLAVYPVLFVLDIYNVFRASGDAGRTDRLHTGASDGRDA